MGVNQHLVIPLQSLPHVNHKQFLVSESLGEEVPPVTHQRWTDHLDPFELREPLLELLAAR